jgi:cytidyltransferase-like protein
MTTVLTYGTFDLFHIGHLNLINRLAEIGDRLVIAVSTDKFNGGKAKASVVSYEDRTKIVGSIKGVDLPRSDGISSTEMKKMMRVLDRSTWRTCRRRCRSSAASSSTTAT